MFRAVGMVIVRFFCRGFIRHEVTCFIIIVNIFFFEMFFRLLVMILKGFFVFETSSTGFAFCMTVGVPIVDLQMLGRMKAFLAG